jgi:methylmalonyl-CoA/ethylmalonyl-CoA epimerase
MGGEGVISSRELIRRSHSMQIDAQLRQILNLNGVSQIGIIVRDLEKAMKNYSELFGLTFPKIFIPEYLRKTYKGKPGDFSIKVALGMMGSLQIELIQVLQGPTVYDELLERKGGGLHHLGFDVKDMDKKIEALKSLGIGILMSGERVGARFAYMDTEPIVGVIVELIEREKTM